MKDGRFRFDWMVALVFIVLGALMGGQFKTQWQLRRSNLPRFARIEVLSEFYRQKVEENEKLSEEIQKLRQEQDQLQKDMAAGRSHLELLTKELEQVKIRAGEVPVEGSGVIVQVKDSPKPLPLEVSPEGGMVHDLDLLQLCNELKAAGAEAMAINGQRIVAMSEIRCSGPVIKVNDTNIGSTEGYTIQAIGDPEALEAGLKLPGGILDFLGPTGIIVQIRKMKRGVVVPALTVRKEPHFAVPVSREAAPVPELPSASSPAGPGRTGEGGLARQKEGGRSTSRVFPPPLGKGEREGQIPPPSAREGH